MSQVNNLNFYLWKLEKVKQNKAKASKIKNINIRVDFNKIKNRKKGKHQ